MMDWDRPILGVPLKYALPIVGGVLVAGVVFFLWRRSKSGGASSTGQVNPNATLSASGAQLAGMGLSPYYGGGAPSSVAAAMQNLFKPAGSKGFLYQNNEQYAWHVFSPSTSPTQIANTFWPGSNNTGMLSTVGTSFTDDAGNVLYLVPAGPIGGPGAPKWSGDAPPQALSSSPNESGVGTSGTFFPSIVPGSGIPVPGVAA